MKEGEIKEGGIPFRSTKQSLKRLFGMKFKHKCLECGKGHDGYIIFIKDQGFTNTSDFCSLKCFQNYFKKNGYLFKTKITEKDICIVCGKEHKNEFFNEEKGFSTVDFCSAGCLNKAYKTLSKRVIDKESRENLIKLLGLFREKKTLKDLNRNKTRVFQYIKITEQ